MLFQTLDNVWVQQALITGCITHTLTGESLSVRPLITLAWRLDENQDYRDVPINPTIKGGGYFAFYGIPTSFFPALDLGENLQCRLTVRADAYQTQNVEFTLSRLQVTPITYSEEFSGFNVELKRLDAPVHIQNISLAPNPISLAGRVIEDNDINSPVEGATVSITLPVGAGETITDTSGYFRLDNLPVVEKITVRINHDGDTMTQEITLDYQNRINERIFSLSA